MSSAGSSKDTKDYYEGINTPDVSEMELQLEQLVQQGVLTPDQAQAAYLEASSMNGVSQNQDTVQAQMDALAYLQDINASGGMTAKDKSLLNQIQQQEATQSRGAREAILSDAQSRGMGGSGLALMSQMKNQQDAATRQSTRDLDVAGMAQDRALQAMMNQGTLAGQIGNQQFSQDAAKAGAKDAIAQFNAQNKQQVNLVNTAANNEAAARNLAVKQGISDSNIGQANTQQQYNKSLIQQNYENQLKKASGQANIAMANANAANQAAQAKAAQNNALLGTAATIAGTAFGGPAGGAAAGAAVKAGAGKAKGGLIEGENTNYDSVITPTMPGEVVIKKEDVPEFMKKAHTDEDGEFDAAGFLDTMTGGKYNYRGRK